MARRRNPEGATGTVQTRRKLEDQRQKAADQLRANIVEETKADLRATARRLEKKPTDSRELATPDPNAGIL